MVLQNPQQCQRPPNGRHEGREEKAKDCICDNVACFRVDVEKQSALCMEILARKRWRLAIVRSGEKTNGDRRCRGKATEGIKVAQDLGNHSAAIPELESIRQMNDLRHCSICTP